MVAMTRGTKTFFQQTNAPTGWTKLTTNTDYTLRIVSGTSGGTLNNSINFSTMMVDTTFTGTASTSGSTSSDDADLPAHNHTVTMPTYVVGTYSRGTKLYSPTGGGFPETVPLNPEAFGPGGAGGAHSHSITGSAVPVTGGPGKFAVNYIDFILASKN
jgi:hypothetical protein